MIKKQALRVREHARKQLSLIIGKIKVKKNSRELTNEDTEILLTTYKVHGAYEFPEEKVEAIHAAMTHLSEVQMLVISETIFQGKTLEQVGVLIGKTDGRVGQIRKEALDILRLKLSGL